MLKCPLIYIGQVDTFLLGTNLRNKHYAPWDAEYESCKNDIKMLFGGQEAHFKPPNSTSFHSMSHWNDKRIIGIIDTCL